MTIDCAAANALAPFWAEALGYSIAVAEPYFAHLTPPSPGQPNLLLIQVPESKTAKNRVHIDIEAGDMETDIAPLIALGATRGETHSMYALTWTVMHDPEGNEFCVTEPVKAGG